MGLLDELNDKQREAAMHVDGPLLIIAGAGSGKTKTVTHRIAYLIKECGVNPYNIMAITFTNKAAGEMRERVDRIVGMGSEGVWVMTFHSSCVRILRRHIHEIGYDNSFTIYDTDDSKSVMKTVFKKLQFDPKQIREATVLREISNAKNELIGPKEYAEQNMGDFSKKRFVDAYREYQEILFRNNALDFDDLIRMTVHLFKACPEVLANYRDRFHYICVDEYQDTNNAQFELVRLLAGKRKNICVVGDDDQSIYKFRGANIQNILNFENEFRGAKVIKLEQNYRSTSNILNAANAVIANNRGRKGKKLWTKRESDEPVAFRLYDSGREEAAEVVSEICRLHRRGQGDWKDFAILYRTNAQSREFEEAFVRENVPYYIVGGVNFYARREIKDVLAYLKTIDNARDDLAVQRIINVPKRGIGATSVAKVSAYAEAAGIDFFEACSRANEIPGIGKAGEKIRNFARMIISYRAALKDYGILETTENLLNETGYLDEIRDSDEDDAQERVENVEELLNRIAVFEEEHPEGSLSDLLEEIALVSDLDNADSESSRVLLMTVHSAKGLEFPRVWLCGMEDGVFPGYMTINSENREDMEEERRLVYVAITRAKDVLTISAARSRMVRGETQCNPVSRFVKEIPAEYLEGDTDAFGRDYGEPGSFRSRRESFFEGESSFGSGRISGKRSAGASGGSAFREMPYGRKEDDEAIGAILKKKSASMPQHPKAPVQLSKVAELSFGKPDYSVGDRVRHVKYGEGVVTALEEGPRDYKVTVQFDEAGQKVMYAAFAKLEKLG
ncbi:MAG: UvrD-helicase domain-containing protein [Lachnospiraceae bacterium]|nr:UvrD-helicase domain-containing protein [Lachnospiraceae bacterium]